ncbi:response regulator [Oceanobacillus sp. FSL H7-0719]|uniref:response regulator n=1 Tax=Oceanobacillus sp. FSL H7-0719 TaxID=2954507 RepID=UPI0032561A54
MIKAMIIDEQTLFRDGMKAILEQTNEYQVIASLENAEQALEFLASGNNLPDIILVELELPDMQAICLTRQIKQNYAEIKVLTLVEVLNEDKIISAINVGTDGFFLKKQYSKKLLHAMRDVYEGETVMSGPIVKMLANHIRILTMDHKEIFSLRLERSGYKFTKRELDVAYLLKQNYSNQEIAKELRLGVGTVKNYISEVYNKLNLRIRKEVIHSLRNLTD